ncbi:mRNA interferase YafQ [Chlamydiales bacterium SCGC AG-110-M15]|nr:mRNA interferase YafQ [Chlamydiales bacterium SCGC AG-110-M15]
MTIRISYQKSFERDLKKMKKREKDLSKFAIFARLIASETTLPEKYREHKLVGNFKDRWESHLEPDWLVVYKHSEDEVIFERTGTHSDLF